METDNNILGDDFKNLPLAERKRILIANADETLADQKIVRPLDSEEREQAKEEYVSASLELNNEESRWAEIKKEWKEKLDPLKKKKKELLDTVATGYEEIEGHKFLIRDHENGRVYTYIESGQMIDSRRMMEHERQSTINSNMRTISNK